MFNQAFDNLLRTYYVLNIEFPKSISVFLNFIMVNIYEINVKSKIDTKRQKIESSNSSSSEFLCKVLERI